MSIIKADNWLWSDGQQRQYVVQTKHVSTTAWSTYQNIAMGAATITSAPTSTSGTEIINTTFQPKYADSLIFIKTSPIGVNETSNVTDDFRLHIHANTTRLLWNQSGILYFNFAGGYNAGLLALHGAAPSWGTDNRTISLRIDNGTTSSNVRFNDRYIAGNTPFPIHLTLMEIRN